MTIRGSVDADTTVQEVLVRLAGDEPQAERTAAGTTSFSARFEDLPDDRRYTPVVRVVLDDGTSHAATGDQFTIGDAPEPPLINTVRGNFQEHILAGRIAVQRAPCVPGLGVCDADFATLFSEHGFETFTLHNPAATNRWYVDPGNIPPS